tara:strand:- start:233 stop:484 length:252 start_codon:yes stop_codon:yes gene_type:complete
MPKNLMIKLEKMKLIEYSWKETRRIKVPDECPSDEFIDMRIFIRNNIDDTWDFEDEDNHAIIDGHEGSNFKINKVVENYQGET